MTESGYSFKGYIDDDAEKLHQTLVKNWLIGDLGDKALFFYDESIDPAIFDFKTGEIAIRIYADEIVSEPRGISFDSISETRTMRIDIRGIDRMNTMRCADQIRLILAENRIRPFGDWQTMWCSVYAPVYPSFKFYHTILAVTLRKYYVMLPNVNINGIKRYSKR